MNENWTVINIMCKCCLTENMSSCKSMLLSSYFHSGLLSFFHKIYNYLSTLSSFSPSFLLFFSNLVTMSLTEINLSYCL